jgi:hypothetical protein
MANPEMYHLQTSSGQRFGPVSIEDLIEWARQNRVPSDALLIPDNGLPARSVLEHPRLAALLNAPPTAQGVVKPVREADDGISTLIPYKNPKALIGYYGAIGNLLLMIAPYLGLITSGVVLWLGVSGYRYRLANPSAHGSVHAWIAIIGGSFEMLVALVVSVVTTIAMLH